MSYEELEYLISLQDDWEFNKLMHIYTEHQPCTVLEIGTFYGYTLWHWFSHNQRLKNIISIDLTIPKTDERYSNCIRAQSIWKNLKKPGVNFTWIEGDSSSIDVISSIKNMNLKIDWLFIDGGHDYKTVLSDYENYSKMVSDNGIIVFHDIIGEEGVRKVWQQVASKNGFKCIEIFNTQSYPLMGIGVIFK